MTQLPKAAAERGRIAPTKLAHAVLRTKPERFQEVVAWYQAVLEAEIVHGNDAVAFMTYDDEHHRIAVIAMPHLGERPMHAVGLDHLAFTYASLGDWIHTYERLKAQGIEPAVRIHHGPTMSLYYLDPDRNQLELQIDVFDDLADVEAFIESGQFQKNPIGVLFDMDDLVKRFHEGVPEAELLEPLEGPIPPLDAFPAH